MRQPRSGWPGGGCIDGRVKSGRFLERFHKAEGDSADAQGGMGASSPRDVVAGDERSWLPASSPRADLGRLDPRQCCDRPRLRLAFDSPAGFDQPRHLIGAQDAITEIAHFRVEIRVGHRPLDTPDRMLDELLDTAAVPEGNHRPRLGLANRRGPPSPITRSRSATTAGCRTHSSVNCLTPAAPACDGDRGGEIDAELAFEPGLRRPLAGQLQHQRMDRQLDPLDRLGRELVRGAQLQARVDRSDAGRCRRRTACRCSAGSRSARRARA